MHDTPIANLDAASFDEFFAALWGKPPFAWQKDLVARVLERGASPPAGALPAEASRDDNDAGGGPWPAAIALPTASGKTACMDIAVFALAAQARRLAAGQTITAPRRIFFVVDRRIIVDAAHERARRLAAALASPEREILAAVATNLRYIACGGTAQRDDEQRPLAVHALRGGMYRSEAWARNPLQPAIIASTVDQTGSRLLFRAYGRSFGTWPVYAGLVGNDSLILLDEAHCAQPFLQTLHAVQRFRIWAEAPLGRPFQAVVMSATPPGVNDVFKDESAQGADPAHPLGRRRLASKPATLQRIAAAEGASATIALATELVNAARRLLGGGRQAVVVFVNRVATARQTGRLLRDAPDDCDVLVLTGRMRPLDKENVAEQLKGLALHSDRSACRNLERPVVVVATQTLEVGADLDFDGLVTECASLDALRQRFGRLNRMGRDVEARAEILIRADQAAGPKHGEHLDPVYGEALPRTWNWLTEHTNDNGEVDFGIARLETLLPGGQALAELNAPAANAPVMLPAHIDCWAQTAPEPQPSPDVAPFLHGPRQGVADVQVCWRADVDLRDEAAQQLALESLALCPPGSSETLPVPVGVFRRWLGGQEPSDDPGVDVEGSDAVAGHPEDSHLAARRVVRWQGARTTQDDVTTDPASIRPGDVVVIPTAHPGPWERLGDLPSESIETPAALDLGDPAYRIARARPILRLHPDVVAAWPDALPAKTTALSLLADLAARYEDDPDAVAHAVRNLLTELSALDAAGRWAWLPAAARELKAEFSTAARLRRACWSVAAAWSSPVAAASGTLPTKPTLSVTRTTQPPPARHTPTAGRCCSAPTFPASKRWPANTPPAPGCPAS